MNSNSGGYTVFEDELTGIHENGGYELAHEVSHEDESGPGYEAVWEAAFEDEADGPGHETGFESSYEDEASWEDETYEDETAFEDESAHGTGFETGYESSYEDEVYEASYEDETYEDETYETGFESSYEDEAGWESGYESGWETGNESSYEDESDQFFPLIGLAAKALPMLFKTVAPMVKKLLPVARRAVSGVVRSVAGGGGRPSLGGSPFGPGGAVSMPGPASFGPPRPPRRRRRRRRETVAALLRRLAGVLGEGESVAAEAEASFFGTPESSYEVAHAAPARDAALTEVLAAEASHTESLPEAQALLGAALPVTIRIMGARRVCGPYLPRLARANTRLVRQLATAGPEERQLLRVVPTIQRRTVASLSHAARRRRLPPEAVDQILAGQAARVLASPRIVGPALLRNHAVRVRTVAPAGRSWARTY